jgi:hypothetical protein
MSDGDVTSSQDERDRFPVGAELLCELVDGGAMFVPGDEIIDLVIPQPSMNLFDGSSLRACGAVGNRAQDLGDQIPLV